MAKSKVSFFCTECGAEATKWFGQCPSCNKWNTLKEQIVHQEPRNLILNSNQKSNEIPKRIDEISSAVALRLNSGDEEFNRVLGGGLVNGSVVLVGGQPGIGKSTLMLQVAMKCNHKVLYVSGEESADQIKIRAQRISNDSGDCYIYTETEVQTIYNQAEAIDAEIVIIDSIQTLYIKSIASNTGSVAQIRECTAQLLQYAKKSGTPIIIIGHITKDGSIAGPKLLEHMVDVVLQFEGDQHYTYRILRSIKNRYGSTDEIGIYRMHDTGLELVSNPSELLISQSEDLLSGSSISASLEGLRPLLMETQALVTPSVYGTPQRTTTGFDLRRLQMLLAVLEKRVNIPLGQYDVFLNIAGGLKVNDPAVDLAVVVALISSFENTPVDRKICFAGEIGLSGEIRSVNKIEQRIQEAGRLGFRKIFIPDPSNHSLIKEAGIEIVPIKKVEDLILLLF